MSQCLSIMDGPPANLDEGSIVFLGTATVILRYGGFTILTDPDFLHHGDHVHLGYGLAPRGRAGSALRTEPQPPIDFALLSRLEESRVDRVVEQQLDRRLPILTTPRAAKALRQKGFVAARGLATWESIRVERADVAVRVTAVPGQHGPLPDDLVLPDVMGAMLEFAAAGDAVRLRLHVAGDTSVHENVRALSRRDRGIDVALFRVARTRVLGVPGTGHAGQGAAAWRLIGPSATAHDGDEATEPAVEELAHAMRQQGLDADVHSVARGEGYAFRPSARRTLPAISSGAAIAPGFAPGDPRFAPGDVDVQDRPAAA